MKKVALAGWRRSAVGICFVGVGIMALCGNTSYSQILQIPAGPGGIVGPGGDASVSPKFPSEPIPKRFPSEQLIFFKTWSLFLINNPQWIVAQSDNKLQKLHDQFEAFGKAIGRDHAAVWFWSYEWASPFRPSVDVDRAAAFCIKLKLPPSGGPYILVTSDYPGEGLIDNPSSFLPTPLKSYYTVSLNNKSADEIITLLTRLADKITAGRLADLDSGSKGYWSAWQRTFEGIRAFLSGRQMEVTIKTPVSDVKIK